MNNKPMWYEDRNRIVLAVLKILKVEEPTDEQMDKIDEVFEPYTTGDWCNYN